jgi:hypothetical protein
MYSLIWEYRLDRGCARTLSWTTASRQGLVVHHHYERARPANRGQPLQKITAAVWLFRARLMRDRAMHRFYVLLRAHLEVRSHALSQKWME